jgi:dolichol kinase
MLARVQRRAQELDAAALPSRLAGAVRSVASAEAAHLHAAYEELALAMRELGVRVTPLRPHNLGRSLVHAGTGVAALLLIEHILPPAGRFWFPFAVLLWAWPTEVLRRWFPAYNQRVMRILGPIAHPHEHRAVNSATWYTTALTLIGALASPLAASLAVMVLGIGDPVAALVGRRWGKTRLVAGRSLEGTTAFAVSGTLAAAVVLVGWHPEAAWWLAPVAGLAGALAELVATRLDDNFTIPLAVAAAVMLLGG